jgi:hypothetical protein
VGDVQHDRPPVGAQAGFAGGDVVLHVDEEGVASLHRDPNLGEEVVAAPVGVGESQREGRSRRNGWIVADVDDRVEVERRRSQL